MSQNQQEQSEAKLLAYIEGELDAEGRAEIEKHLQAHPQHRRLLDEMRGMRDWVRWLPRETAPGELAEGFQGKLERSVLLGPPDDASANPMRINRWPQMRAAAAVAALAIGLGAIVFVALPSRFHPYATLPSRTPNETDSTPVSGQAGGTNQGQRAAKESGAPTSVARTAPNAAMDLIGKSADDADRVAIPDAALATHPFNDQLRLATDTPKDSLGSFGRAPELAMPTAAGAASTSAPMVEPAVVMANKELGEPTAELDRLARGAYQMVNADPMRFALDGHLARSGGFGGGGGADKAKMQFAESEAAKSRVRNQYVMVVLSTDTDRARKQIGDYLGNNGIRAQIIVDRDASALAEATTESSRRLSDSKVPAPSASEQAAAPAGPAPGPAQPTTRAERYALAASVPPAPAPAAASGRPSEGAEAKARAAVPPPPADAARPAPSAFAPAKDAAAKDSQPARTGSPLAGATPSGAVAAPNLGDAGRADASDTLMVKRDGPIAAPDSGGDIGDILVARRMTARQARDLQAKLSKPQASQWAQVYSDVSSSLASTADSGGRLVRLGAQKSEALADETLSQKTESRDAESEAMLRRKGADLAVSNANALGKRIAPETAPAAKPGTLPMSAAQPQATPRGAAPVSTAERFRAATTVPAIVAAPTTGPAGGAMVRGSLGAPPADRIADRGFDGRARSTSFNAPATQPGDMYSVKKSVPTTAPSSSTAVDDQPVDIVILLQQSPPASAPPPSAAADASQPTLRSPAAPTTRPAGK